MLFPAGGMTCPILSKQLSPRHLQEMAKDMLHGCLASTDHCMLQYPVFVIFLDYWVGWPDGNHYSPKNIQVCLNLLQNVLWTDEAKLKFWAMTLRYIWHTKNAYCTNNTIPTMIAWWCKNMLWLLLFNWDWSSRQKDSCLAPNTRLFWHNTCRPPFKRWNWKGISAFSVITDTNLRQQMFAFRRTQQFRKSPDLHPREKTYM